jgi:hypothetical protein
MKKALLALAMVTVSTSVFAQSTGGTLNFKTLGIQKADGSGTYNVPIFQSNGDTPTGIANDNGTVGAGSLTGGATLGLFVNGSSTPFFTSILGTTTAQSPYAVNPASGSVTVPGTTPGQQIPLTIRVWQGSSFATAQSTPGQNWREWTFTTKPLGGDPGNGGLVITPPTLTGWGPETGTGYELNVTVPEPSTIALGVLGVGALVLARRRK